VSSGCLLVFLSGDIVLLNKGDIIPADIRIVQSYNLILSNGRTSEDAIPEAA
jgi:magnesium-transporting ATPase (P-type)